MTTFEQGKLISEVTALLQADSVLSRQVYKFESGLPEVEGVLDRLVGGQVNVVDMGVSQGTDIWRDATVVIIVSTREPSVTDSDQLNTAIGDAIQRVLMANPQPGQLSLGVLGRLKSFEMSALRPLEDSPMVRVREIQVTYKVFR